MKAIAYGILAVVGMGAVATALTFTMVLWIDWAGNLTSPFWSTALSPIGALMLAVVAVIFRMGYEVAK